jgi:hypothetical protein
VQGWCCLPGITSGASITGNDWVLVQRWEEKGPVVVDIL